MFIRSKSPLRIGLAGGGTDVSPYSDLHGGVILNATINMYAYATIEPTDDGKIVLHAIDKNEKLQFDAQAHLPIDGHLDLLKGIYNRVVRDYTKKPMSFRLSTYVDAPSGSGLGSSSSLVVAILAAFAEWQNIPLGEYELAKLAFDIERKDLAMAGGKQDQYAAAFGGFNLMEFYSDEKVIVNPLRIKEDYLNEMQFSLLLYYTGTSRLSSKIIEMQSKNISQQKSEPLEAMHQLKLQAVKMKEAILKGNLDLIGEVLNEGWQSKKQTAAGISNPMIDEIYIAALSEGASGGKISGAGGGGFMFFWCPAFSRYKVIDRLHQFGGEFRRFQFTHSGASTWRVK